MRELLEKGRKFIAWEKKNCKKRMRIQGKGKWAYEKSRK